MEWGVRHATPAGTRGKAETPQRSEEAQIPPRGKCDNGTNVFFQPHLFRNVMS
ncbi:hypothetical protein ACTHAL_003880 [Priestia flexa]|uniref:hypothetical protein n=1 Tax=Priestia TaxID=2800373 RepID=UPI0012E3AA4B|nr:MULTISPECIES: hypothetical protein [Priestia]